MIKVPFPIIQDPTIAYKILELGLKRYMKEPAYVLAYIDYMKHLNEDNNTLVLFERALGSGYIPPEKSSLIWDKFRQFQSYVGNQVDIINVDRRRRHELKDRPEFQNDIDVMFIERYKFMELLPCNESELQSMGYREISRPTVLSPQVCEHPRPDYKHVIPFKPVSGLYIGYHPVPGGDFPPPPIATKLILELPPPTCFHGPFVKIDQLINQLKNLEMPKEYTSLLAESTAKQSNENAAKGQSERHRKRQNSRRNNASSDDDVDNTGDASFKYQQPKRERV